MKKNILSIVILLHCISIHASEPKSWLGSYKSPTFLATAAAAVGSITALTSLWAWNRYRSSINEIESAHTNLPDLAAEETSLRDATAANETLKGIYDAATDSVNMEHWIGNLETPAKQIKKIDLSQPINHYRNFYGTSHEMHRRSCAPCHTKNLSGQRPQRCMGFVNPYLQANEKLQERSRAHKKELERAQTLTREHADLDGARETFNNKKWWAKAVGCTGTTIAVVSWLSTRK